jgi:hypothetical protein
LADTPTFRWIGSGDEFAREKPGSATTARNVKRAIWTRAFCLATLFLLSSCSFFSAPPPLPRRAAIEPSGSEEKFATLIQEADIIYFPSESVALHSRSEAAWKLLETLRRRGSPFAIGWDWSNEGDRRSYLDEASRGGAEILALNDAKWRSQNEAGLSADQFVANEITAYVREHRNDKLLVFLRRERLGMGQGVPYLVAQKNKARQLILNPRRHSNSGLGLLAFR